ncbi:MAG: hypothetical protein VX265_07230 [Myxococcota bacterium]|nr:hypothetical protein [Myxococcota bacterium]MEC8424708.1 hypothetical protein [Myxococcota bacterium]
MRTLLPSLVLSSVATAGCAGGGDQPAAVDNPACAAGTPVVEVGSGVATHAPLTDGDPVPVARHPRGGWYVPVSFRATHVDTIVWAHARVTAVETGELVAETSQRVQLVSVDDCAGEYWGLEGFMANGIPGDDGPGTPTPLDGVELEVAVTVENLDGSVGTASALGKACLGDPADADAGPLAAPAPETPPDRPVRHP